MLKIFLAKIVFFHSIGVGRCAGQQYSFIAIFAIVESHTNLLAQHLSSSKMLWPNMMMIFSKLASFGLESEINTLHNNYESIKN